jgi:hypothetical protein
LRQHDQRREAGDEEQDMIEIEHDCFANQEPLSYMRMR